jgi:hypothetical protein
MEIIVIASIMTFMGVVLGYLVGKGDGRWEERRKMINTVGKVSWENSTPVERYHMLVIKEKLIEALREEWHK